MENGKMFGFDWEGIIGLLIIAGIFGYGNGFGNWGNGARADISNEFLYNQLANDVRANGQAIAQNDRDILENRYQNALQTNTLQSQASINALQAQSNQNTCCCELKTAIHAEGEATRALITQNRIADLEKDLVNANTIISNATQSQNILNALGNYFPKTGVNPYYVYGYGYNGTTIM